MQGGIYGALNFQTADSGVCRLTGAGDDSWGGADQHPVHAKGTYGAACLDFLPSSHVCLYVASNYLAREQAPAAMFAECAFSAVRTAQP